MLSLAFVMRVFQPLFGIILTLLVWITAVPLSAQAASSAAIRAYDDVESSSKDFSNQNLIRAEFANAKLKGANFSGADLRGAPVELIQKIRAVRALRKHAPCFFFQEISKAGL